jgi:hypothetical protein
MRAPLHEPMQTLMWKFTRRLSPALWKEPDSIRAGFLGNMKRRLTTGSVSETASRVENRRSGFSLPVAIGMLSHGPPQSGLA